MQSYAKKKNQLQLAEEAIIEIEKIAKYQLNTQVLKIIDQFWKDYFKLECPRVKR